MSGKRGGRFDTIPATDSSRIVPDLICQARQRLGLGVMPMHPTNIHDIPEIKNDFVGRIFPNAQNLADCLATIQVHEYMRLKDQPESWIC